MINELLTMNGYGLYVWSSFLFTFLSFLSLYLVVKTQYVKEKNKFIAKFWNLNSQRAASARNQSINKEIFAKAQSNAKLISEKLDYVGTMCVEYFIDQDDNLLVNEIAPRVHNSGHLTINAFNISQFENHIRAVCGLDLEKVEKISNAEMFNVLGKDIETYRSKSFNKDEFFYDYGKKSIKDKRKMGHLTVLKK